MFLHNIKEARDKLQAVGVNVDNEELLHIVLKGLPREYHPLCSAIHTRTEQLSFDELHALLHVEEKQLQDSIQSNKNSALPWL